MVLGRSRDNDVVNQVFQLCIWFRHLWQSGQTKTFWVPVKDNHVFRSIESLVIFPFPFWIGRNWLLALVLFEILNAFLYVSSPSSFHLLKGSGDHHHHERIIDADHFIFLLHVILYFFFTFTYSPLPFFIFLLYGEVFFGPYNSIFRVLVLKTIFAFQISISHGIYVFTYMLFDKYPAIARSHEILGCIPHCIPVCLYVVR